MTVFFLARASDGKQIRITHTYIGMTALALLAMWFGGLLLSVRAAELTPRGAIIPTLAALEFGAVFMAWVWLVWCGSENYRIEFKRDGKTGPLLIAWLTVLFLG